MKTDVLRLEAALMSTFPRLCEDVILSRWSEAAEDKGVTLLVYQNTNKKKWVDPEDDLHRMGKGLLIW